MRFFPLVERSRTLCDDGFFASHWREAKPVALLACPCDRVRRYDAEQLGRLAVGHDGKLPQAALLLL